MPPHNVSIAAPMVIIISVGLSSPVDCIDHQKPTLKEVQKYVVHHVAPEWRIWV